MSKNSFLSAAIFCAALCFFHPQRAQASFSSVSGEDLASGKPIERSAGKKGLVVLFLSAECPCSNDHIQEAKTLPAEFPDFNFIAVHSNVNEKAEESLAYFKKASLPFPVIQDKEAKIADEFKALKTPHAFLVMPDGKIVFRGGVSDSKRFGNADRKFLREALEDAAAGKPVRTPEARTLGCVISRG